MDDGGKEALINAVNQLTSPTGATYADDGMTLAYNQLNHGDDTRKIRTTVLFTDGDPGNGNYWTSPQNNKYRTINGTRFYYLTNNGYSTWNVANNVINIANNIKNLADESKEISSTVYTVSVISSPSDYAKVYLGKTSSEWAGAQRMATIETYNGNRYIQKRFSFI